MGFGVNGCRKAVYHTKNAGIEAAMEWVMEHMGDPGMHACFYYFFFLFLKTVKIIV